MLCKKEKQRDFLIGWVCQGEVNKDELQKDKVSLDQNKVTGRKQSHKEAPI